MAFVKFHVACPKCKSSDAVSINDDGSAKCFSCGDFMKDFEEPYETETNKLSSVVAQEPKNNVVHFSKDDYIGIFSNLTDRKIREETAKKYNVRVTFDTEGNINEHYYPYYCDRELVGYKIRKVKTKKFVAHDEKNDCNIGDTVRIMETRPLSKTKCWRLVEIIERAK